MPDPGADFDALVDEFYGVWLRYHPDAALGAGVAKFGYLLPAQDDDDLAALGGWLETLILALDEIDFFSLDPDRQLDFSLLASMARLEHRELLDFDWRRRDPLAFLPVSEIHRLTLEPSTGLSASLARLLGAVPEHLRQAQGQLREVAADLAPAMIHGALLEAQSGRCYLRELVHGAWFRRERDGLVELESLVEEACDALADYREFLAGDLAPLASGALGCGGERLALRMEQCHFLELGQDLSACRDLLHVALGEVEGALACHPRPVAQRSDSSDTDFSPGDVADALRREIQDSALVTLPEAGMRLGVQMACPRFPGGQVDYVAGSGGGGTLYLPPLIGGEIEDPVRWFRTQCLAQGWGGSHLFAFSSGGRGLGLTRRLANGVTLRVGWNLYLERRLAEQSDPRTGRRYGSLLRRREQLILGLLDLDIHESFAEESDARTRLRRIGFEGSAADMALIRLASAPGDALAGALGWILLEAARDQVQTTEGGSFRERRFNDLLVSQGPIPLPVILRHGFGQSLWDRVSDQVFGFAA